MDDDHVIDTMLFFAIGFLSWLGASVWETNWLLLFGLPWWIMFLVSMWRVLR